MRDPVSPRTQPPHFSQAASLSCLSAWMETILMPCAGSAENTVRTDCAAGGSFAVNGSRASPGWLRVLVGALAISAAAGPARAADPQHYAVVDSLFLQRTNEARERPLVVESTKPLRGVISAGDFEHTIGTGVRLIYGDYGTDGIGWETAYVGVWGMDAKRTAADPAGKLQVAGDLGLVPAAGLTDASAATASWTSSLDMAELNLVFHDYDGGYDPAAGRPTRRYRGYDGGHLDWLAGFRWAGLGEQSVLALTPAGAPTANTYAVHTYSNLFAVQAGARGRIAFERWAFEGWMKVGIAGTSDFQSQSMAEQLFPDDPYRSPRSIRLGGMGMIADMNISAIYRFNDVWGLRAGYNLLWLTGVALAPDQWDFTASRSGGSGLNTTGSLFLGGANLGLEARW